MNDSNIVEYIMQLAINLGRLDKRIERVEGDIGLLHGNDTTLSNLINSLREELHKSLAEPVFAPPNVRPSESWLLERVLSDNAKSPSTPDHETDIPEKHEGA